MRSMYNLQVQDFILFEDRLDNSLQRDLTKMEHVRMRLTHEPAVPETIDIELLEFKFIFDRSMPFCYPRDSIDTWCHPSPPR